MWDESGRPLGLPFSFCVFRSAFFVLGFGVWVLGAGVSGGWGSSGRVRDPVTGRWLGAKKLEIVLGELEVVPGRPEVAERVAGSKPAPKPSECTQYVRRRVAARLPEIVDELLEKSKTGDAVTLKALWQMGQLDREPLKPGTRRRSGLARELLEKLGKGSSLKVGE